MHVYDPATGTWAARANMPTARALFGASAVGGTIYAIGGTTIGLDKLAVVEAYDTVTDTWTRRADMPTPRNALSTAVVDGKVYAIGGWGIDRPEGGWESLDKTAVVPDFSTVEVYDPKTDSWATRADMPTARSHMTVSAIGGKIYAIGGGLPPRSRGGQRTFRCWRCTTLRRIAGHRLRTCRLRAPCCRASSSTAAST